MRKAARHNLRFRIPNRAPQHPIASIFNGDYVAVSRFAENFQHFGRINPVVAMRDSGARSDDNSSHRRINVERPTSNVQRSTKERSSLGVESWPLSVQLWAMQSHPQSSISLPGIKKLRSGKVREVFDLGDTLLFVVTDRLSAFDVILPDPIPFKGAVLNQISAFWFERFQKIDNHFVTADFDKFPDELSEFREQLAGRSMIVRKTTPLTVECVVRGYLAGSGWKEYQQSQSVCGIKLPPGLQLASPLPEAIFTPSTKAEQGHDENIDMKECRRLLGEEVANRVEKLSLQIYSEGRDYARERGIIVADTKFEFGTRDGKLLLIDECLTPDSSRFWPADRYRPGSSPPSFDKQFVRDYLETLDWDKTPPAPHLPHEIVEKTSAKYREAFERLTGDRLMS
jgi:phosphoribosylaminoimidazole-succinocarboxamide synthase